MLVLLTRYVTPSSQVGDALFTWLSQSQHKLAKLALANFEKPRVEKDSGKLFTDWPPSIVEIDCLR